MLIKHGCGKLTAQVQQTTDKQGKKVTATTALPTKKAK